ncbi:hypothetical protein [Scytonema hofmannii]|uniref:hypothetical protein n=1 Tax=Scytonema hofmannii TaxID=34078 RepID=UPI0013148464|nr:hypothetical protein [Scytonema hofmannii]
MLNKSLLFWHKTIKLAIVLSGALTLEDFQASPDSVLFTGVQSLYYSLLLKNRVIV